LQRQRTPAVLLQQGQSKQIWRIGHEIGAADALTMAQRRPGSG
jgi:hypothetical protein